MGDLTAKEIIRTYPRGSTVSFLTDQSDEVLDRMKKYGFFMNKHPEAHRLKPRIGTEIRP